MNSSKDKPAWQFKWRIITIYVGLMVVVVVLVVLTFMTDVFKTAEKGQVHPFILLLIAFVLLMSIIAILSKTLKIIEILHENGTKLERITAALEKNRSVLTEISQSTRLSETAKAIVFRDADKLSLREAVFDKIHQRDFDSAYEIIDEVAHHAGYNEIVEQLRAQVDRYRGATDDERVNQIITDIDKLLETHQWVEANAEIERLTKTYPTSERAKAMRQKLADKMQERKKVLLNAWDDAVRRRATDRSLEILKELDLYLTPDEGLALQEAAKDVFRDKLHNLGVQFSLAVSSEQWQQALRIGEQIIRDFPNSRMADEIREKMDILMKKVQYLRR